MGPSEPPCTPRPAASTAAVPRRIAAEIVESRRLPAAYQRLVLRAAEVAQTARPGQFLHVWVHSPEDIDHPPTAALLRRPYSISRLIPPTDVEILLRVRGTGGRILAAKRVGDTIDLIGPLGRGFEFRPDLRTAVVVAGGAGLAPVPLLVQALSSTPAKVILMVGAERDDSIPYQVNRAAPGRATVPELTGLGAEVAFVSESTDGLLITELVEARLSEFDAVDTDMFAVGPRAMLKRLAEVTEGCLSLQVSLEERMACGLGACRSCVVPVRGESVPSYKTVCRDGPVFPASEIDWERLEP